MKKYYRRLKRWMSYNPPGALSSTGWRLFRLEFKENAPIRYWFEHDFRKAVVLPIKWKYSDISDWIRYRTYDKYHIVKTGLKPGYYDKDTIMLNVNFDLLRKFVEEELAWRAWSFDEGNRDPLTFVQRWVPFGLDFRPYNNPERGIKHLEWESTLDDPSLPPHEQCPSQAIMAREKLFLYNWWMKGRPGRVEVKIPMHPKHQKLFDDELDIFDDDFDSNTPEFALYIEKLEENTRQEEDWSKEDEEMLIRLIKIRGSMWT